MLQHGGQELQQYLLHIFNDMLATGMFEDGWRHMVFRMLPKTGNPNDAKNWRPIAVLQICYKVFATMLLHRLQPGVEKKQSSDQAGFRKHFSVEDAHLVLETMVRASAVSGTCRYGWRVWICRKLSTT